MEKLVSQESKYQVVDKLSPDVLLSSEGKAFYTKAESKYLEHFNPFALRDFTSFSYDEVIHDPRMGQSIRMAIFSLIVTMDAAVCYGSADYKYLTQEKLPTINPYLSIIGLEEIKHGEKDNPVHSVWKTRMSGLQALTILSNIEEEFESDIYTIQETDRFKDVYKRVSKVIGKDDMAVVYGSSINSRTPNDIDVMILQKNSDYFSYENIMNWAIKDDHVPKISLQVIPIDLLNSFLASDPYDILVPGHSFILNKNKCLHVNQVTERQRSEMCKYRVGYQLARARNSLTTKFFKFYLNSEAKTRNEFKQAKFARRNLMRGFKVDIPESREVENWQVGDGVEGLRYGLIELNMQLSNQIECLERKGVLPQL